MNILKNSIDSIQLGIDDFESNEDKRIISSVRNLYAGILLLFKELLLRLSPSGSNEVLLKTLVLPLKQSNGTIFFKGIGKKTVNRKQIKERFQELQINVDWKRVERIAQIRNDIEHYFSIEQRTNIREAISNLFIIIRDFIIKELEEDPLELLTVYYWNKLLNISEVFEKEHDKCVVALNKIDWQSSVLSTAIHDATCEKCGSILIFPNNLHSQDRENIKFKCRSCNHDMDFSTVSENSLISYFSLETYLSHTDGNELALAECPNCLKQGFVLEKNECVICSHAPPYEHCSRCGNKLTIDERHLNGLCGHCEYQLSKDD